MNRFTRKLLILGIISLLILPWFRIDGSFWSFHWLSFDFFQDEATAPLLLQFLSFERWWLLPVILPLCFAVAQLLFWHKNAKTTATVQIVSSLLGLAIIIVQSFLLGDFGVNYTFLESVFSEDSFQYGLGMGAVALLYAYLLSFSYGIALKGFMKGDVFAVTCLTIIIFLVLVFVFFPVFNILIRAFWDTDVGYSLSVFFNRFGSPNIWSVNCFSDTAVCGVAWSTAFLALMTALSTTLLGLAFALVVTRTNFRFKGTLRVFSVLPIITPPFVVGMALLLLLGNSGVVTQAINNTFDVDLGGWIYGFWGLWLAQTLSYTPIAFLVLIGVVEGVSPSMEEASQTLGANSWKTFTTVTLPLMRPGLANAFLLGFVESMADLRNALVLGGDYQVLSAQIFYSVAGASADEGKAASLAITLLIFTLSAFFIQKVWVGNKSYTTVTGKGDGGVYAKLPRAVSSLSYMGAIPWSVFTGIIYLMVLLGGFVTLWGVDNSLTLMHYIDAFRIEFINDRLVTTGVAWDSFLITIGLALIAMPLTSCIGLLTGYLLSRVDFTGKTYFEFSTMLSFAIPGIVIGVSYVVAFNQAPIDLTFTGLILILCFVFRNMSVSVRASMASLSQLDPGLDEASVTLGSRGFKTIRKIILPLIKPAITASMIYSFIRSITSISAVIFLVSADYNLASAHIIGLVEQNQFGISIAYSTVLIVVMAAALLVMKFLIGDRKIFLRSKKLQ